MRHFTPTAGIRETGENVRGFVRENMDVFWRVLKPLLPYIVGFYVLDLLIALAVGGPAQETVPIGRLVGAYFYAVLAVSWNRAVLEGPENFTPMNPLRPQRRELVFIGALVLLSMVMMMVVSAGILLFSVLAGAAGQVIGLLAGLIAAAYLVLRASFCFPALALNAPLEPRRAFAMSKGCVTGLFLSSILASFRIYALLLLYGFLAGALLGVTAEQSQNAAPVISVLSFLLGLPLIVYFQPLLAVINVTVVSNYYQHVLQNRPGAGGAAP